MSNGFRILGKKYQVVWKKAVRYGHNASRVLKKKIGTQVLWSELDENLLGEIMSRLGLTDQARFRAVCKRWNSARPITTYEPLPWLVRDYINGTFYVVSAFGQVASYNTMNDEYEIEKLDTDDDLYQLRNSQREFIMFELNGELTVCYTIVQRLGIEDIFIFGWNLLLYDDETETTETTRLLNASTSLFLLCSER
ncbi:hypothetical protein POM88_013094 [Heracleum sosnowskyi]|uniref:F-box domain-containing protein n=1 Tax=Heracleum sosnowskyi TaxID=360622 RepID=A0AAD8N409_9APIA|nr:hypothetical protein POM88_013094 [Heracleum sosnowskyi]